MSIVTYNTIMYCDLYQDINSNQKYLDQKTSFQSTMYLTNKIKFLELELLVFICYVTGGCRECRQCVGMVADGSDIELYTYRQATQWYALLTGRSLKSYIGMRSVKSGVSRVLGLPTKPISMPKVYIRSCHVLTVTDYTSFDI